MSGSERVVMVTSSYPRFAGDTVGTFLEPIAKGLKARGHEIHIVLPWHPRLARAAVEDGLHFHPFRYAPSRWRHLFGYAGALEEDVRLRASALAVTPVAIVSAWRCASRVARQVRATIVHAHWVVPGGMIAALVDGAVPHVISLHGSDLYVAERYGFARRAARFAFHRAAWVTACSDDLRQRAHRIGADPRRTSTIAYGVDAQRFRPDVERRASYRRRLGLPDDAIVVLGAGRFVPKKGFEHLIDAFGLAPLASNQTTLVLAGSGDLDRELRTRAERVAPSRVRFIGLVSQDDLAGHLAAADIAVVPSIRDEAGNVDGLPNVVMEALASATPLVATPAGGIASVVEDHRTGLLVAERSPAELAAAIARLAGDASLRARIGSAARQDVVERHSWSGVATRFEEVYQRAHRPQGCL